MKKLIKKLPLYVLMSMIVFGQISCGSYVSKMHKEFAYEKNKKSSRQNKGDPFDRFRDGSRKFKNPTTYTRPSTKEAQNISPLVKRQYSPDGSRRHTTDDLTDLGNSGSLWSDMGQGNYLFSKNKRKRHGDIIIVKVLSKLKEQISLELKNSFPDRRKSKKGKDGAKEAATADVTPPPPEAAPAQPTEADKSPGHVYDTISSTIVEEIKNDYVLIRGKKELLFKKRKHVIELQALVNRKDLADDDSVPSNKILESNISVIR